MHQDDRLDPKMVEIFKAMTHQQRLEIANGMWRSAKDMIERLLRQQHPDWTEDQIRHGVALRMSHGTQ
jgi:hypothetical protein